MKKVNEIQEKSEEKIIGISDIKEYEDPNENYKDRDIEDELPDFELDLEVDEKAEVHSIDGVIIEGDDEIARLLFYYYKTNGIDCEGELVRCKCVGEFRVSRAKLKKINRDITSYNIRRLKSDFSRENQNFYQEKLPMYS
jgi:hypothetical protein